MEGLIEEEAVEQNQGVALHRYGSWDQVEAHNSSAEAASYIVKQAAQVEYLVVYEDCIGNPVVAWDIVQAPCTEESQLGISVEVAYSLAESEEEGLPFSSFLSQR